MTSNSDVVESLQYDLETIIIATDNFSDGNMIGRGGYGVVYKGSFLDGREIAVKRLGVESRQGEREFENEVMLLAKLQHRNLVRLLGFYSGRTERLLIYEFVPQSSLDQFIFNFGLASLFAVDETQRSTSRIAGTSGYMAPEYSRYGEFSVKSDVFSFGVLVLEILSGQNNNSFCRENGESLLSYAWKTWREGIVSNLIDPTLRANSGSIREIIRCINIGLLCVQENVAERPNMASVVIMLSSSSLSLPIPSEPAFFLRSFSTDSDSVGFGNFYPDSTPENGVENPPRSGRSGAGSGRGEYDCHP